MNDPKVFKTIPIEFMAMSMSLPINSKPMIHRLMELMDANDTNSLSDLTDNFSVRTVLWMLMSQVFGQMSTIDMSELWQELYDEYNRTEV
jgi:hypothetical protein